MSRNKDRKRIPPTPPVAKQDPLRLEPRLNELEQQARAAGLDPQAAPCPPDQKLGLMLDRAFGLLKQLEANKKSLDEALAGKSASLANQSAEADRRDKELGQRKKDLDKIGDEQGKRHTALDERERELQDENARLLKEKVRAEAGFLEERKAMLVEVDRQLDALRKERAKLLQETTAERTQWADEDHRQRQSLAQELQGKRDDAMRILNQELEERRTTERKRLEAEAAALDARAQELRTLATKVEADRQLIGEDREALDAKVARLVAARCERSADDFRFLEAEKQRAEKERDTYHAQLAALRAREQKFHGQEPQQILDRLDAAESARGELQKQLSQSPTEEDRRRLVQLEQERKQWEEDRADLERRLQESEIQRRRMQPAAIELETCKTEIDTLATSRKLLETRVGELKTEVESYREAENDKNPLQALGDLDVKQELLDEPVLRDVKDLKELGTEVRLRLAQGINEKPLYYTERDIRCYLAGMAMSRLLLLEGISGTGKTSLATGVAKALGAGLEVVSVQAGWRDRQDLLGYYNAFHRHYYAQPFLKALYTAGTPAFCKRPFFIVLDEINLSRVEQFFADFLSALELRTADQRVPLLPDAIAKPPILSCRDGTYLPIPGNVWFVGTANHDETTTEFADKTYDRAHVLELPRRDSEPGPGPTERPARLDPVSLSSLRGVFKKAQRDKASEIERARAWLAPKGVFATEMFSRFRVGWGNRLEDQVARYVPAVVAMGGKVGEAMDHIVQTRVLRKIRDQHSVMRQDLVSLRDVLRTQWKGLDPETPPYRSIELLEFEMSKKDAGS